MNRRILLIDSDPTFRTHLTIAVQKHRIEVSRIRAVGKGEGEPLAVDPFDQTNRRVQFARAN